jgi:hypothetical protein
VTGEAQLDFRNADPFPHAVLGEADVEETLGLTRPGLRALAREVERFDPGPGKWYRYENALERKLAYDVAARMPKHAREVLTDMNAPAFLGFLEDLTGIAGLIPDPYYRGGGIHRIRPGGGKLDVHVDFNRHEKLGLYRRLNVILYLNEGWQAAWGGALELWRGHRECPCGAAWPGVIAVGCPLSADGRHCRPGDARRVLTERRRAVLPELGTMVVFETSERSYHGHPDPVVGDRPRLSLATYYYTAAPGSGEPAEPHSTVFVARPGEEGDAELRALREDRGRGRLASNV